MEVVILRLESQTKSMQGPAPESLTDKIFTETMAISQYFKADLPEVDLHNIGVHAYGDFKVEVIDSCNDYVEFMKEIFDFGAIRVSLVRKFRRL